MGQEMEMTPVAGSGAGPAGSQQRTPMRQPKLTRWQAFKRYLHNTEAGTYMGRTSESWRKILGAYLIFYALIVAFFALCMGVFVTTLPPFEQGPRHHNVIKQTFALYPATVDLVRSDSASVNSLIGKYVTFPVGDNSRSNGSPFATTGYSRVDANNNIVGTYTPGVNLDLGPCNSTATQTAAAQAGAPCVFMQYNRATSKTPSNNGNGIFACTVIEGAADFIMYPATTQSCFTGQTCAIAHADGFPFFQQQAYVAPYAALQVMAPAGSGATAFSAEIRCTLNNDNDNSDGSIKLTISVNVRD